MHLSTYLEDRDFDDTIPLQRVKGGIVLCTRILYILGVYVCCTVCVCLQSTNK